MKARIFAFAYFLCLVLVVSADVIRLEDGTMYFGKVTSAAEGVVSIEAFGKTIRVASSQIVRTEVDFTAVQQQPVEVILVDGSVIRGRIKNYDEEVGLFVELGIGELTIPLESLRAVEDPAQRSRYRGFPFQASLAGGYFLPAGAIASSFDPGFTVSLSAELSMPFLRGLFAGLDLTQFFISYVPRSDLTYSITTATFGPYYRLLFLRTSPIPVIRDLVPWIGLGAGVAYVGVNDELTVSAFGEIDPVYFAAIGLDFYVGDRFVIRIGARWLAIQQTSQLLHLPSAGIGVAASF